MPIQTISTQAHTFSGLQDLDDVIFYIDEPRQGSARLTFVCFAQAWTAFFRDLQHGESPLDRLLSMSVDQLVGALQWGTPEIMSKDRSKEKIYLRHMIDSVRKELCAQMNAPRHAPAMAPALEASRG